MTWDVVGVAVFVVALVAVALLGRRGGPPGGGGGLRSW